MTDDTTTRGEKSVDYKEKVPTYLSSSNKENMFIHIYKSLCVCVRASVRASVRACVCVRPCVRASVRPCVCVCVRACVCVCIYSMCASFAIIK